MLKECPLCLTRVLPMANGCCPSCQGDMASASLPDVAKVELIQGDRLPNVCVSCGGDTDEAETVWSTPHEGLSTTQRTLIGIALAIVAWPLLALLQNKSVRGKEADWCVHVPRCSQCKRGASLKPDFVNQERHSMRFVVAREFAEAVYGETPKPESPAGSPYRHRGRSS